MAKRVHFLKTSLLIVCLLLAVLMLFEIGVRFWGYSEHYIYGPIYKEFEKNKDIPYTHKPNLLNAQGRGFAVVNTDALGLRSKIAGIKYGPKKDNEYRIVILGDSVTFGEGIKRAEDTFAQILEDILNIKQHKLNVKVFNYGVSAYSVKDMVATLQYRALDVEPDLVFMAIIPDDFRLDRTIAVDRFGYTFNKRLSDFMPKDSIVKRLLRKVRLVYLLRDIRYYLNGRNSDVKRVTQKNLPNSYAYLKKFKEISEKNGLSYSVVLLPDLTGKFENLSTRLKEDKIDFIDLSFLQNEFNTSQFMASKFDYHPSAIVHKRIGELLSEYTVCHQLENKGVFLGSIAK